MSSSSSSTTVITSRQVDPSVKSKLTFGHSSGTTTATNLLEEDTIRPNWWRPYVQSLTRTWDYRPPQAWCKQETRAIVVDTEHGILRTPSVWWSIEQQQQQQQQQEQEMETKEIIGRRQQEQQPKREGPPKVPGLIYVKSYKASSSTCESVALNIAYNVGRRMFGSGDGGDGHGGGGGGDDSRTSSKDATAGVKTVPSSSSSSTKSPMNVSMCMAHTRHEFADQRQHSLKSDKDSLLWSFVRNPQRRDLSHVYHFDIAREGKFIITNTTTATTRNNKIDGQHQRTNSTQDHFDHVAIIDAMEKLKGKQTRYLVPWTTTRATRWPRYELSKSLEGREAIVSFMKKYIMEYYDFLGVVERMNESLAVMVVLWGLDVRDVVVLNSKRSGGYDDGGGGERCVRIPKAHVTPEIQRYFDGLHATWNADYLLYQAANDSLDETIDKIGRRKIERITDRIEHLQQIANDKCLSEAIFPCSPEGKFQPALASKSCYVQDAGCGHACVDKVLAHEEMNQNEEEDISSKGKFTNTPVFDGYCQNLIERYGFWEQRQCDLWQDVIEGNKSIDMTPYLASNIAMEGRWWPPTTSDYPPGAIEITVPEGRGQLSDSTQQNNGSKSEVTRPRRGRIIYHLHIHKSGGSNFCQIFQKARLKHDFIRILGKEGIIRNVTTHDMISVSLAMRRVQLANTQNNCNNPDAFWKSTMDNTISKYKILLNASQHDLDDFNEKNITNTNVHEEELVEAVEYARAYGGLERMSWVHDHLNSIGWHQYAPYLGDTRATSREIYYKITGDRPDTTNRQRSRRRSVPHNLQWIYVANEGSLELEPIFGAEGPYFYSIILREPMDWIISMYRYDAVHMKGASTVKKPTLMRYLNETFWGGPQFFTRRLCGLGCVFPDGKHDDPSREQFLRAKSFLENFDLIWTLEAMNALLEGGVLGRTFPALDFMHEHEKNISTPGDGDDDWKVDGGTTVSKQRRRLQRTNDIWNRNRFRTTGSSAEHRQVPRQQTSISDMKKIHRQGFSASKAKILPPKRPPKPTISSSELDLIRQYTWQDKVLYEYAKKLMEAKKCFSNA